MGTLGPGNRRRSDRERGSVPAILSPCLDLYTLMAKKVHAGPPMIPPAPVPACGAEQNRRPLDASLTLTWRGFAVELPFH
jgi:hypothetical protein